MLRSFGKFFGLAGLRLGFVVAAEPIAAAIRGLVGEWPVSSDALAAGLAAYADRPWAERERATLQKSAQRLDELLVRSGFEVAGGTSLFRLARASDARERFARLARGGNSGSSVRFRSATCCGSACRAGASNGAGSPLHWVQTNMSEPGETHETERDRQHAQAMKILQQERRAERATKKLRGGLLIVLTGAGKGKSSSAFGMVARALGWDMRVGIVQFIKGKWQTGEKHFFRRFPEASDVRGDGRRLHLGRAGSAARHCCRAPGLAAQLRR